MTQSAMEDEEGLLESLRTIQLNIMSAMPAVSIESRQINFFGQPLRSILRMLNEELITKDATPDSLNELLQEASFF
jgi:hypothetical protein